MEEIKIQKLPKWFNGELYTEGAEVTNPFSKKSYELNNIELSMYDFIIGAQMIIEMRGGVFNEATFDIQKNMARALGWFRNNNAKAYMVLLD